MSQSFLEATLAMQLKCTRIKYEREYRFHPTRRWRYDFYLEDVWGRRKVLVDVQGGLYTRGKHARPAGYRNDAEKMHAAQQMGYQVIHVTPDMVKEGRALEMIEEALSK